MAAKTGTIFRQKAKTPTVDGTLKEILDRYIPITSYVNGERNFRKDSIPTDEEEQKALRESKEKTGFTDNRHIHSMGDYALLLKETADSSSQKRFEKTANELMNYLKESEEAADDDYSSALSSLSDERKRNERAAAIEYEKLLGYLPEYLESVGLSGLGVSESSLISAKDDYMNVLGEIARSFNANKSELEKERNSEKTAARSSYDKSLQAAGNTLEKELAENEKAYNRSDLESAEKRSEYAMNAALAALSGNNMYYRTPDQIGEYILSLKKYMTSRDWSRVLIKAKDMYRS